MLIYITSPIKRASLFFLALYIAFSCTMYYTKFEIKFVHSVAAKQRSCGRFFISYAFKIFSIISFRSFIVSGVFICSNLLWISSSFALKSLISSLVGSSITGLLGLASMPPATILSTVSQSSSESYSATFVLIPLSPLYEQIFAICTKSLSCHLLQEQSVL